MPTATIVEVLRTNTLLQGVPEQELKEAAASMTQVRYEDGETILREGDEGDDCFFIITGEVQVTALSLNGGHTRLAVLGPGSLIGEIALLASVRRTASVAAAGTVEALRLNRDSFEALSAGSPLLHESLIYSARIRGMHGLLSKASIWSSIPDSELRGLAEITVQLNVKQGEVVVREGDNADCFYTVGSGSFEVRVRGKRVAVLQQGDYFGEVALLSGSSRTATVKALEDGQLLTIGKQEFEFILKQYEPVRRQFLAALRIRRPDLAEAATLQWAELQGAESAAANWASDIDATEKRSLRPRGQQRWMDILMVMGGLFLLSTVLAALLKTSVWVYAALLTGAMAGPVTFVAYARGSQLLGFRLTRLISVFATSAAVAVPLAIVLERRWLFAGGQGQDAQAFARIHVPLSVALIEEASKLLVCYLFLRGRTQRFKMDAIVFGAAAGMGFAAAESLIYGWTYLGTGAAGSMLVVLWLRALLSPFGHGTWTAIAAAGIWLGLSRTTGGSRARQLLKMAGLLLVSILLHTLWDYRFASGPLRMIGMAAVGAIGILLLLRLLRAGAAEELQALSSLNPSLVSQADGAAKGEAFDSAAAGRSLTCSACATQCPPGTRYCPRCGQALRVDRSKRNFI